MVNGWFSAPHCLPLVAYRYYFLPHLSCQIVSGGYLSVNWNLYPVTKCFGGVQKQFSAAKFLPRISLWQHKNITFGHIFSAVEVTHQSITSYTSISCYKVLICHTLQVYFLSQSILWRYFKTDTGALNTVCPMYSNAQSKRFILETFECACSKITST